MAYVRKAEGMSKRFKDWVQNIGPLFEVTWRLIRTFNRDYISTLPPNRQCTVPLHYRVKQLKLLPKQFRDKVEDLRDEMQDRFESLKRKWREGTTSWTFSWADFQWAATMVLTRGVKCNGLKLISDLRTEFNDRIIPDPAISPRIPGHDSVKVMHLGSTKHLQYDGLKKLPFVHILICWIILVPHI